MSISWVTQLIHLLFQSERPQKWLLFFTLKLQPSWVMGLSEPGDKHSRYSSLIGERDSMRSSIVKKKTSGFGQPCFVTFPEANSKFSPEHQCLEEDATAFFGWQFRPTFKTPNSLFSPHRVFFTHAKSIHTSSKSVCFSLFLPKIIIYNSNIGMSVHSLLNFGLLQDEQNSPCRCAVSVSE